MHLVPINPPLRKGQKVICSECGKSTAKAKADVDGPAFSFVCAECEQDMQPVAFGDVPKWRRAEDRVLRRLS